jgi:cytochrome bd ubiquinol oxidase subunit I
VLPTFVGFRTMVGLGTLFIVLTVYGWFRRNKLLESPTYLKIMLFAIPLPYIAMEMGWIVSEIGRQPWIVYGLMLTAEAASPITTVQVFTSLTGFILVYGLLGAVGVYLMAKTVKQGPEAAN